MALVTTRAFVLPASLLLLMPMVTPSGRHPTPQQDCGQTLDVIDRDTKAFNAGLAEEHVDWAIDKGVEKAIEESAKYLKVKTAPTKKGAAAVKEHIAKLTYWEQIQEQYAITMKDLLECIPKGNECLIDFKK